MQHSAPSVTWRYKLTRGIFLALGALISIRLFTLQIINHDHYRTLAAKQHQYQREIIAERGKIYSSDGTLLATTEDAYFLFVVPPEIQDPAQVVDTFLELLPLKHENCFLHTKPDQMPDCSLDEEAWESIRDVKKEELLGKVTLEDRLWVPIMRGLSVEVRDRIAEKELAGVHFDSEKKRAYPEKSLAAHILGFVGSDQFGRPTGYFGLEGYYNGELAGVSGYEHYEVDANGRPIPIGEFDPLPPKPGMNLTVTIKRELQFMLDTLLKQGVERYQADSGTYILLDPKTGAIWAMGNYPAFEPGNWTEYIGKASDVSQVDRFTNLAISSNYEPGSVMKMLTMSAGLDTGTVTTESTYNDTGSLHIQGHEIKTWNDKYSGKITMAEVLQLSNNPGAATVGLQIGFEKFIDYLQRFGIGQLTHIDLQGEESGLVKLPETWRDIDLATAAFGQGLSITPIQIASMVGAIANDGVLMKPYIVQEMYDPVTGDRIRINPEERERAISKETAQKMRELMRQVVQKGEFQWFVEHENLTEFPIAGKTGTAQIPIPGGYDLSKTNVTFAGFAPVDDPVFVLLVRLHKPRTSTYSADTAVPLWLKMSRDLITYFGIPPE